MTETSSNTVLKVESIKEYRQRTGKSKEELRGEDYAMVAIGALEAAGLEVKGVSAYRHYEVSDLSKKPGMSKLYRFVVDVRHAEEETDTQGEEK
jgi:hypothetical protein